jgi:hypothetical protein
LVGKPLEKGLLELLKNGWEQEYGRWMELAGSFSVLGIGISSVESLGPRVHLEKSYLSSVKVNLSKNMN